MPRSGDLGAEIRSKDQLQHCRWDVLIHLLFGFYSKELKSVAEEHQKESLVLSQLISLKNEMLDDKTCMELQQLLQTKSQYDSLIKERKALLADLNNQVRTSGPFLG